MSYLVRKFFLSGKSQMFNFKNRQVQHLLKSYHYFKIIYFCCYMSSNIFPRHLTARSMGCGHLKEQHSHKSYLSISIADCIVFLQEINYSFIDSVMCYMCIVLGVRDIAVYQTKISFFREFIFYPGEAYNKQIYCNGRICYTLAKFFFFFQALSNQM